MLDIHHFNPSLDVNACVKQLVSCVHGGTLWLDEKVEITIHLISKIIGLSIQGEDTRPLFSKETEKDIAT